MDEHQLICYLKSYIGFSHLINIYYVNVIYQFTHDGHFLLHIGWFIVRIQRDIERTHAMIRLLAAIIRDYE